MSLQAVSIEKALMKAKSLTKKGDFNQAKNIYKNVLKQVYGNYINEKKYHSIF